MRRHTSVRAPNSILLVVTGRPADVPPVLDGRGIAGHGKNCIAVGTVAEDDGDVEVVLTDEAVDDQELALADETDLDATAGFVAVETVHGEQLFSVVVGGPVQHVRVWVTDLAEPDRIVVELVDEDERVIRT